MKRSIVGIMLLAVLVLMVGRFTVSNQHHGPVYARPITLPVNQSLGTRNSVVHNGVRTTCGGRNAPITYRAGDDVGKLVNDHVLLNPAPNMGTQADLASALEVVSRINSFSDINHIPSGTKLAIPSWCAAEPL